MAGTGTSQTAAASATVRSPTMAANSSKPCTWSATKSAVDAARARSAAAPRPGPGNRRCPAAAGSAARPARRSGCGAGRSPPGARPASRAWSTKRIWWMLVSAAFLPQKTISRALARSQGALCLLSPRVRRVASRPGRPAQIAVGGGAAAEEAPEGQAAAVQQPLGAAGGVVEDRLGAVLARTLSSCAGDLVQGLVPADAARRCRRAVGAAGAGCGRDCAAARRSSAPSGRGLRRWPGWPGAGSTATRRPSSTVTRMAQVL